MVGTEVLENILILYHKTKAKTKDDLCITSVCLKFDIGSQMKCFFKTDFFPMEIYYTATQQDLQLGLVAITLFILLSFTCDNKNSNPVECTTQQSSSKLSCRVKEVKSRLLLILRSKSDGKKRCP